MPQADRATSAYVLNVAERLSLIDCGGGATSSFLKRGFDPLNVDRVFISHTHPDHVCDLPLFIQMIYLKGRQDAFDIYVPAEFAEPLEQYLRAVYIIAEKLPFELRINGYENGFAYDSDFKLTAKGNKHLMRYRELIDRLQLPNRMQCHSFDLDVDGSTIFYSSDIADFDDIRNHVDGKGTALIESTHIDMEELLTYASTAKVGQWVITHLGDNNDIARINRLAKKAGVDNMVTAVDGMVIGL